MGHWELAEGAARGVPQPAGSATQLLLQRLRTHRGLTALWEGKSRAVSRAGEREVE